MNRIIRQGTAVVGLVGICLYVALTAAQTRFVSVGQGGLRTRVISQVMPEYPPASVASGSAGVVVSLVTAEPDGRIQLVEVLQSPDPAIAAAVRDAVMQWTIRPPQPVGATTLYSARDKLTFYFQIRDGKGVVLYPEQVPGNEDVFAAWDRPVTTRAPDGAPGLQPRRPPAVRMMGHDTSGVDEIDDLRLGELLDEPATILIDVRDREPFAVGAHPRAINIPFDEVSVRAGAELPRGPQVVIDCSQEETSKCQFAATQFRDRGFERVAIYIP